MKSELNSEDSINSINPVVVLEDVVFSRGERLIFKGINLSIRPGKITAIMGPSGTGKTTLLQLMGGLLTPNSGEINVLGHRVADLSRGRLFSLRQRMGLLFQSGALFTDMTVFENVAFALREHTNLPESMIRDIVLMKLQAVGLRGARDLYPSELSGGMARRVALARAVALDPEILMYDEPFTGQDPISMGVLIKLIKTLNQAMGLTSIIVSHDVHEVCSIADDVFILSDGLIIAQGTPEEILKDPDPKTRQFMLGEPDGPVAFDYPALDLYQDFNLGFNLKNKISRDQR